MDRQKNISDLIYDMLDYMYCDNCRFNSEKQDTSACDDCHRKYNGWGISRSTSDYLASKIAEMEG